MAQLDRDAEAASLLAANGGDADHLPLVIAGSGEALQGASPAEVAALLGLTSTPSLPFYDLYLETSSVHSARFSLTTRTDALSTASSSVSQLQIQHQKRQ